MNLTNQHRAVERPTALHRVNPFLANYYSISIRGRHDLGVRNEWTPWKCSQAKEFLPAFTLMSMDRVIIFHILPLLFDLKHFKMKVIHIFFFNIEWLKNFYRPLVRDLHKWPSAQNRGRMLEVCMLSVDSLLWAVPIFQINRSMRVWLNVPCHPSKIWIGSNRSEEMPTQGT